MKGEGSTRKRHGNLEEPPPRGLFEMWLYGAPRRQHFTTVEGRSLRAQGLCKLLARFPFWELSFCQPQNQP
jgi:hypothetical protein